MQRRDAITALPLAILGATGLVRKAVAGASTDRPLHLLYLDRVRDIIERIRANATDDMIEASYHIAKTYTAGRTCFAQWETGHSFDGDMFTDRPGDTDLFVQGYTMGTPGVEPRTGDLLLASVLRQPLEDPREKGIFVIGGPTPWCGDTANPEYLIARNKNLRIKPYSDIWIETYIPTRGALMRLPGMDAPLGPTSGALGMVTYWAMCADAVRVLARDGVYVDVRGDEPGLADDSAYVNPADPLGERYLSTALAQIAEIEAEDGTIRRMATGIAETVLSGGRLWVYSRHRVALSAEANAKRGGLALIKTTWDGDEKFDGNPGDYMIMGTYTPDDPVDRKNMDMFRKKGMTIATIGTTTRDGRVPENAVTMSSDLHLGNMCDTYGLFAVKGVKRKVCPTSGLLANCMLWAVMIRLADEIMERTGNTPAVLSTGAVIGGGAQRGRMNELVTRRGF